ncbi:MAG: hypothetical protein ACREOI_05595 [bacterium]
MLKTVSVEEAITHTLWEAHTCIGQWAFCACLAMFRKALDLWSAEYRDRHGMTFDKGEKEHDNLFWRLRKIAESNPLYSEAIHSIIDKLRLDANDAVHQSTVCAGGRTGTLNGITIINIRQPYEQLYGLVVNLITTTMPNMRIIHSDIRRWKKESKS